MVEILEYDGIEEFLQKIINAPIVEDSAYLMGTVNGKLVKIPYSLADDNNGQSVGGVGDILFYDNEKSMKTIVSFNTWNADRNDYPISRYTPIGVVVIPSSHNIYGNGQCAVISLREMSFNTPDEGANAGLSTQWGCNSALLGSALDMCVQTGTCESPTSEITGVGISPNMPSDYFDGAQCPTDTEAYYKYDSADSAAPSPYLEDGSRNSVYYQTSDPSSETNCLADFDGVGNTQLILDNVTVSNWKTSTTIANSHSEGHYPAACCCWRYHTDGTQQGDWYLPACGELGYVIARLAKINGIITDLIDAYGYGTGCIINTNAYYWSSSEYSSMQARRINTSIGIIDNTNKIYGNYVRAFIRIS